MGLRNASQTRHRAAPFTAANPGGRSPARLFLFRRVGARAYALTGDPTGANLPRPAGCGLWVLVRRCDILPGEVRADFDPDAVLRAVGLDGYALIASPHPVD